MTNKHLSIAIPTYNRAEVLRENLLRMIPEIEKHEIAIFISDDSNNNETYKMVQELKTRYKNIFYAKNEPGLGHDRNCQSTLKMAESEYVWYLGDSRLIVKHGIDRILDIITQNQYDFIVVSTIGRNVKVESQIYDNPNKFFVDLAWHATLTGVTIYKTDSLFKHDYALFLNSNFMQLGILLTEFLTSKNGLFWINEELIDSNMKKGKSYWKEKTFEVFAQDWVEFILSLSTEYSLSNKHKVMRSHSDNTEVFTVVNFIQWRRENVLSLKSYFKYRKYLVYASTINVYIVFLIALTPRFVLNFLVGIKHLFEK